MRITDVTPTIMPTADVRTHAAAATQLQAAQDDAEQLACEAGGALASESAASGHQVSPTPLRYSSTVRLRRVCSLASWCSANSPPGLSSAISSGVN